jgi:hypothetical protein
VEVSRPAEEKSVGSLVRLETLGMVVDEAIRLEIYQLRLELR